MIFKKIIYFKLPSCKKYKKYDLTNEVQVDEVKANQSSMSFSINYKRKEGISETLSMGKKKL